MPFFANKEQNINNTNIEIDKMENNSLTIQNKVTLRLHPNPTSDYFQVTGNENDALVTISDLNCRILLTKKIFGDENIKIDSFRKGVYIAKIVSENGIVERKLVIS